MNKTTRQAGRHRRTLAALVVIVLLLAPRTASGVSAPLFGPATTTAAGSFPFSVAIQDLDGDLIPDLVAPDAAADEVLVLLGNGDGTFGAPSSFPVGATQPISVVLADFNGDNKLDVATADYLSTRVSVLLGNADGTFGPASTFTVNLRPFTVAAGHFNADASVDLVTANQDSDDVSVLLGNGDGTFAPVTNITVGTSPQGVVVADFDGDTHDDIVASNFAFSSNSVSVLLGDGTGSFAPHVEFPVSENPETVSVGDVNGDLIPDVITPNESTNDVSVLLGDGTGSFAPHVEYPVGLFPQTVAISDVNRDGNPDLITANIDADTVSVLLGNGDGTFAPRIDFLVFVGSFPGFAAAGDVNGDLKPDLVTANYGPGNLSVMLNTGLLDQTITFPSIADHRFGDPDFALPATTSSGLPLSYSSTTPLVCTVIGGTVHVLGAGTCTIQADQFGDPIFNPASPVVVSFPIGKESQAITFTPIVDHQLGDPDFLLAAITSAGLPLTFSSNTPSVCTVTGALVHLVDVGTCAIQADQIGDANVEPAPPMIQTFTITNVEAASQGPATSVLAPLGQIEPPATRPPSSTAPIAVVPGPTGRGTSAPTPVEPAAGVHPSHSRAALPASLPTPDQVDVSPQSLLTSMAIALLLVLLLLFPAELFNNTLEEHYDEITAGLNHGRERLAWLTGHVAELSGGAKALLMCGVGGLTCVFLDPQATFDPATIAFGLGMTGALAVLVLAYQVPAKALLTRHGHPGAFSTFPAALVAGMLFVLLSRAASFQPGFAFGLIAGWAFATASEREEGRAIGLGAVVLLGVALLSWFVWAALPVDTTGGDPSFVALVLDSFFACTFVAGIEGLVLALVPIRLFDGDAVRKWSRTAHLTLLLIGTFLFVHILIGGTNYIGKSNTVSAKAVAVTFSVFATFSITFYCYWRWRTWREEGSTPTAAIAD